MGCSQTTKHISSTWVTSSLMHILITKLKIPKEELKIWNKTLFGNVHDHVKGAKDNLDIIQSNPNN